MGLLSCINGYTPLSAATAGDRRGDGAVAGGVALSVRAWFCFACAWLVLSVPASAY